MKEPVLVIMAAGMGSRYGGLKQIDPVTDQGEIILDFSLYDAMMAGFKKAIFVIKEEILRISENWWMTELESIWKYSMLFRS